jgi:hypothetical protein
MLDSITLLSNKRDLDGDAEIADPGIWRSRGWRSELKRKFLRRLTGKVTDNGQSMFNIKGFEYGIIRAFIYRLDQIITGENFFFDFHIFCKHNFTAQPHPDKGVAPCGKFNKRIGQQLVVNILRAIGAKIKFAIFFKDESPGPHSRFPILESRQKPHRIFGQ